MSSPGPAVPISPIAILSYVIREGYRTMRRRDWQRLTWTASVVLATACSGSGNFVSATGDDKDESSDATGEEGDESADTPEAVSGAYLTCTERKAVDKDDLAYGCNLADRDGAQVALADVATEWTWRAVAPSGTGHEVRVQQNDAGRPVYQVVYYFSGKNPKSYADDTRIKLDMTPKKGQNAVAFASAVREARSKRPAESLGSTVPGTQTGGGAPKKSGKPTEPQVDTTESVPVADPNVPAGPDRDHDKVVDAQDLCSNSPAGSNVWKEGEWIGCSEGEYRDSDDPDLDRVGNPTDRCPDTPFASGGLVNRTPGDPYIGCAPGDLVID